MSASPEILKRFHLFAGLPGEVLASIAPLAEERTLPDGATLFAEGAPANHLFLILDGQVSLEKRVLARFKKGMIEEVKKLYDCPYCGNILVVEKEIEREEK